MFRILAGQITGWDYAVACGIVLFVEYFIKKLICKVILKKEPSKVLMTFAPIVVGVLVYVALAFVQKVAWYLGIVHGLAVGMASQVSYDKLLKLVLGLLNALLTKGIEGVKAFLEELNGKAKEIIDEDAK